MCSAKTPKAPPPASPPPMNVPESVDEQVMRAKSLSRQRAASSFGRQSTVLASNLGPSVAPTSQAKTLLGS